ncbi:MAG TPA: porin, partial [Cyclobacteriaceae bacterium]|nr:porin [Cyclobacteriaceae bacterium]
MSVNLARAGNRTPIVAVLTAILLVLAPALLRAQDTTAVLIRDSTTMAAEWLDYDTPKRKFVKWNEFDGVLTTVRIGFGFLIDGVTYVQDNESKQQLDTLEAKFKVRDSRIVISGRLKTKRPITWKAGIMYDGAADTWLIRESGVMVAVPELKGDFFIGRTKEGFSLSKVMNGYFIWGLERQMAIDLIPILADGVRWSGYNPKRSV